MGYQSEWTETHLPDRKTRNDFYITAGELLPPKIPDPNLLNEINIRLDPKEVIEKIQMIKERMHYEK